MFIYVYGFATVYKIKFVPPYLRIDVHHMSFHIVFYIVYFVLYNFVLYLVHSVACVSGLFLLDCPFGFL